MGLTKGSLQSFLAFCPPPLPLMDLSFSYSFSIPSLRGGGHAANRALLASLCKAFVIYLILKCPHRFFYLGNPTNLAAFLWVSENPEFPLALVPFTLVSLAVVSAIRGDTVCKSARGVGVKNWYRFGPGDFDLHIQQQAAQTIDIR
ncbi:hypothetical protein ACSQ67_018043 [Phaseolus vulgaris]